MSRSGRCLTALLAAGAGASVGGCTLPVRSFYATRDGLTEISLRDFPELRRPGGLIKIRHPAQLTVYVRCGADDTYDAISGVCTHQGCVVDPVGEDFHCPCHGSTYDRNGSNTSGPARAPLERYAVRRVGDTIVVDLSETLTHG